MEKQDLAIIEALQNFLEEFDCAFYALEEPIKKLEKYFDIHTDWDWVIYVHVKTSEWEFSHWYILDVDIADLQSIINWLKNYTRNVLRLQYWLDV